MTLAELTFCRKFQRIIFKICHICHDRSCIGTITKNQIKYLSMKRQEKQKKICITFKSYMSKKGWQVARQLCWICSLLEIQKHNNQPRATFLCSLLTTFQKYMLKVNNGKLMWGRTEVFLACFEHIELIFSTILILLD